MTYWEFHLFFTLPALVAAAALFRFLTPDPTQRKHQLLYLLAMAAIAFFYTTPWDNYLVKHNIWSYGPDRVSLIVGYVPIEEYTFFLLQPVVAGLLMLALRNRSEPAPAPTESRAIRIVGATGFLAIAGAILLVRTESFAYLRLIAGWSLPVVAGQWLLGGDYFVCRYRLWALSVSVPTVFFSIADRNAIQQGIWDITAATSTGILIARLPVEEFLFFLVTNILVVQGLMLFLPDPGDYFTLRLLRQSDGRNVPTA